MVAEKQMFGERMREARELAGLTNRQVAERLANSAPGTAEWYSEIDTMRRNLRRWLNGKNKPSADIVIEYARICGVAPDFFHGRNGDVMTPLMLAIEALVDSRIAPQVTQLRQVAETIPDDVSPFDAVAQACLFARGRAIVAQAEVIAGNVGDAQAELDRAIARLSEALERTKAA